MAQRTGALVFDERTDRYDIRFDLKANVKKLYSPKTGKTYDGTVVLADTGGKYVNYRIEVRKN